MTFQMPTLPTEKKTFFWPLLDSGEVWGEEEEKEPPLICLSVSLKYTHIFIFYMFTNCGIQIFVFL